MKKDESDIPEEILDDETILEFCKIHEQVILDNRPIDIDMQDFIDSCEEKIFLAHGR